ncbi:MBL fold metallo-hydrolase [Kitasatospora fiedleri]|uniref:MBL fold metallo-hydrolase n=1 Tax=Kitasatospora fiedleri TaxID=2991545 RepID=UPI00249A3FA3|nr:MBL fold metallo-hydrolase [Kitasatospora fiedleri]
MLLFSFPAGGFGTNCYVLAAEPGGPCLVVDPGQAATDPLLRLFAEHRLEPAALLLTHGHMDHSWCARELGAQTGAPAVLHAADRFMLADPAAPLPPTFPGRLLAGYPESEPERLTLLEGSADLELAGLRVRAHHGPGHTEGSTMFRVDPVRDGDPALLFTGDTLLADRLGDSGLPGGSRTRLESSLRRVCGPLDDSTVLLPGHGPAAALGTARRGLPLLRGEAA